MRELDQAIVEELFDSITGFSRTLRSLAHRREGSLRRSDVVVLRMLQEHGELRASDIAQHLCLNPSVISRQLAILEEDGIVTRRPDAQDRRVGLIQLSPKGRDALAALRREYTDSFKDRLQDWDRSRIHDAAVMLTELTEALRNQPVTHSDSEESV